MLKLNHNVGSESHVKGSFFSSLQISSDIPRSPSPLPCGGSLKRESSFSLLTLYVQVSFTNSPRVLEIDSVNHLQKRTLLVRLFFVSPLTYEFTRPWLRFDVPCAFQSLYTMLVYLFIYLFRCHWSGFLYFLLLNGLFFKLYYFKSPNILLCLSVDLFYSFDTYSFYICSCFSIGVFISVHF